MLLPRSTKVLLHSVLCRCNTPLLSLLHSCRLQLFPVAAAAAAATFDNDNLVLQRLLCTAAVDLGQGFPQWEMPDFVKDLAVKAVNDGCNKHSPKPQPSLVEAVARKYSPELAREIDPTSEVAAAATCTPHLDNACLLGIC